MALRVLPVLLALLASNFLPNRASALRYACLPACLEIRDEYFAFH